MISFVSECNRRVYCMSAARTSDTIASTIGIVLVWLTTVCFSFYFVRIVIGGNCFTSKGGLSVFIVKTHA